LPEAALIMDDNKPATSAAVAPVALPNLNMFLCGYNLDGSLVSTDRQLALAFFGSGSIDMIALNQSILNLRSAIGF